MQMLTIPPFGGIRSFMQILAMPPLFVKQNTNKNRVYSRHGPVVSGVWTGLSPRVEQQDRKFPQRRGAFARVWRTRLAACSGVF